MAACASGEERFLRAVADYAWAICEETAWQLPAYNSYVRDITDYPGTIALSLMSAEQPVFDGETLRFSELAAARLTTAELHGVPRVEIQPIPLCDPRLRAAWPETIYRTRIRFARSLSLDIF